MAITSGTPVKSGYYLDAKAFKLAHVARDGEALAGERSARWVRIPTPLALVAAPVVGGLFVVAFPVIGAVALVAAVARKLAGGVREGAAGVAANLAPGPLPGEAHLTGKAGEAKEGAPAKDAKLDELGKAIDEKRSK